MVMKIFCGSDFIIFSMLIGYVQQNGLIHLGEYFKKLKILWSVAGVLLFQCGVLLVTVKYIGSGFCKSSLYPWILFPVEQPVGTGKPVWRNCDCLSAGEKLAKRTTISAVSLLV